MSRASLNDTQASRIELSDHQGVTAPARRHASRRPGRARWTPVQTVIDIDSAGLHPERRQAVALGREVLGVSRAAAVSDNHFHRFFFFSRPPSPGTRQGGSCRVVRRRSRSCSSLVIGRTEVSRRESIPRASRAAVVGSPPVARSSPGPWSSSHRSLGGRVVLSGGAPYRGWAALEEAR